MKKNFSNWRVVLSMNTISNDDNGLVIKFVEEIDSMTKNTGWLHQIVHKPANISAPDLERFIIEAYVLWMEEVKSRLQKK